MGLCLTAWRDLSSCRSIGMVLGPIPWTAIAEWCRWHALEPDVARVVIDVIRRLDNEYLERAASKEP